MAKKSDSISLVALLREPRIFEAKSLVRMIEEEWKVDLGDGKKQGADGFFVAHDLQFPIRCHKQMFVVNQYPTPYFPNPQAFAEQIQELRLRKLVAEHKAWVSVDAVAVDGSTPAKESATLYPRMAPIFANMLDEMALVVYLPDRNRAYVYNERTDRALRAADPIAELSNTQLEPIVPIAPDDPTMLAATAKARQEWPRFVQAFARHQGDRFTIKAPIRLKDAVEFIWISVTSINGDNIIGVLANQPSNLGSLQLGSRVVVALADLNDWVYFDLEKQLQGGFTMAAVDQADTSEN